MISLPHPVRVFVHAPPTDLRKGFDALSGLVSRAFGQDPTSGHLFLFVNRRRDRLTILCWDRGDGWRSGTSVSKFARSSFFQPPAMRCRWKCLRLSLP
jgi:transposase